jgi:hypothetical protein
VPCSASVVGSLLACFRVPTSVTRSGGKCVPPLTQYTVFLVEVIISEFPLLHFMN